MSTCVGLSFYFPNLQAQPLQENFQDCLPNPLIASSNKSGELELLLSVLPTPDLSSYIYFWEVCVGGTTTRVLSPSSISQLEAKSPGLSGGSGLGNK